MIQINQVFVSKTFQVPGLSLSLSFALHCALVASLFVAVSEVKMSRQTTLGRSVFNQNALAFFTCTVHRAVISVEHFAKASAGFFALLASVAVQRMK